MKRKTLAQMQIGLGILLFVLAIFGGWFILFDVYLGGLATTLSSITESWGEANIQYPGQIPSIAPEVVSDVVLASHMTKLAGWIAIALVFVLAGISINLILQGMYNLKSLPKSGQ